MQKKSVAARGKDDTKFMTATDQQAAESRRNEVSTGLVRKHFHDDGYVYAE